MYIPMPWIILLPYRLISLFISILFRKRKYSERDKQILNWLAKPDDPLRSQDFKRRRVAQLSSAIETGTSVYLKYAERKGITSRRVIPKRLFRRGTHIYVEAFCLKRREYRRFRMDRIEYLSLGSGPEP